VEEAKASHLRARMSEMVSQLYKVALEDNDLVVGTNLTVRKDVAHLHKILG
jgi:hypothetical protein